MTGDRSDGSVTMPVTQKPAVLQIGMRKVSKVTAFWGVRFPREELLGVIMGFLRLALAFEAGSGF